MDVHERIDKLEVKIAYMEDYVDKLNSVILEQNENIAALKNAITEMKKQKNSDAEGDLPFEKPPHY